MKGRFYAEVEADMSWWAEFRDHQDSEPDESKPVSRMSTESAGRKKRWMEARSSVQMIAENLAALDPSLRISPQQPTKHLCLAQTKLVNDRMMISITILDDGKGPRFGFWVSNGNPKLVGEEQIAELIGIVKRFRPNVGENS